jgi:DNA repair exonuclease SbcCD ATPase subunit
MKFLQLSLQNFLTVGEANVNLADRGLLLVQGENVDDSSASSNGSGKSSIVDGLCWTVYGTTARGVTGDAVVNRTAKKNTKGALYVRDGEDIYRILRHRKHSAYKNSLLLDKVSSVHGASLLSLTKGTDKETQEVVNKIIGCSYEVFTSSIYAGQERMPDLPAMTDKFLKSLIEEAAGVEVLEKAHTIAKEKLNEQKSLLADAKSALENVNNSITATQSELEYQTKQASEFEATKRTRAKSKLSEVLVEQRAINEAETSKAKLDRSELIQKRDKLEQHLKDANDINHQAQALKGEWQALDYQAKLSKQQYDDREANLRKSVTEIKSIDSLVGTGCKECGKEIHAEDIADARTAKVTAAKAVQSELAKVKVELQKKFEAVETAKQKANEALAKVVNVVEISQEIQKTDKVIAWIDGVDAKIKHHQATIDSIKKRASEMLIEPNPYQENIDRCNAKLVDLKAKAETSEANYIKSGKLVELHTQAVGVYGAGGVRAHILDTVTPFLNEKTADYLSVLADGNIHATWTTLTRSAKGELKEKFSIAVTNDEGADSFAGLSGGEKRKVRLATALALQDLVASRATKPIELFIGDEIDEALDSAGIERLMTVLDLKARERGTVLVISHNDLNHFIDQVIVVEKKGGLSMVHGDNL